MGRVRHGGTGLRARAGTIVVRAAVEVRTGARRVAIAAGDRAPRAHAAGPAAVAIGPLAAAMTSVTRCRAVRRPRRFPRSISL